MTHGRTVFAFIALLAVGSPAAAQPAASGYLNLAPLSYAVPPLPTDPLVLELDLEQVRTAIPAPNSIQFQEARSDADAYDGADIVRRFDDAAGQRLDPVDRPLLVAMLTKVIVDAGAYVDKAKAGNARPRPYVEDSALKPLVCNMGYLNGREQQSYPSGHAMNGYATSLVLAEVFPGHRQAIIARGVRYGDNRVACGVHHPIDVQEGRLLGIAYFDKVRMDAGFQADLRCAQAEQSLIAQHVALPKDCENKKAALLRASPTATTAKPF